MRFKQKGQVGFVETCVLILARAESTRTGKSCVVLFMTLSVKEMGHHPETNLQKHVRVSYVASLGVVLDTGKMTLTDKPDADLLSPLCGN